MKRVGMALAAALILNAASAANAEATNRHYPANRAPLAKESFVRLPLGAVKPLGWLKDQLVIQASGLTGHLDAFWPDLLHSAWKGQDGEGWERGPYYLDGLVPLAYLLDDERLIGIAKPYIEWMLASGRPDGWFGPAKNKDRWPLAVALKVLMQYHEATNDDRAIALMTNYFRFLKEATPDWPDKEWRGVRAMENAVAAHWLYNRTGNGDVLAAAESIYRNSFDWAKYFLDFPFTTEVLEKGYKPGHPSHVVNIAMGVKYPGVWYSQFQEERLAKAAREGLAALDKYHGQVGGRFAGDEHLSGRRPTQGTELCAIVEYMFSLENLVSVFGDAAFADRLEMLAYNGNPGTCTPDYWAHQYDQQANQVLVSLAKRNWRTNGDESNLYGLEPNYGCCTANMHQGWPKLVAHLWMATHDQGLAAIAYGPSVVKAKVADGTVVTIAEETDYPFDGTIRFTVRADRPVAFPLHLRIPGWAAGAELSVADQTLKPKAAAFAVVERQWKPGDVLTLTLPMNLRTEKRYNDAVAIYRGPLVFSLRIGEKFEKLPTIRLHRDRLTAEDLRRNPQLAKMAEYYEKTPLGDYAISPTTPWNYALVIDPAKPDKSITVSTRAPGRVPFANDAAPVTLKAKGKAIPAWGMQDNSAADPPPSPVASDQPAVELELIPYGNTRLRITEFPVAK